jgi:hypothetical protein
MLGEKKNYYENDVETAVGRVESVHGVGGIQDFTPNTFKERLFISPPTKEVPILKKGMTFNLTSEYKTKIVSYVTETLPFCLGLSVTHVRRYVHLQGEARE